MSQFQNKYDILEREFHDVGYNSMDSLDKDGLLQVLDKKSEKQFDRDLFQQLFERVEKNYQNKVRISDFIKVIMEAEEILQSKIENTKNDLEEYHRYKREATLKQQQQSQNHDNLNQYGIMQNSKLTVEFIQVQYPNLPFESLVGGIFRCGGTQYESQVVQQIPNSNCYKFDERIQFDIETGMEDLEIKICVQDSLNQQSLLGSLTIPLNRLKDQHKHEEVLNLYDNDGHLSSGKVYMTSEWIYSNKKYLQEMINKWENHISQANIDLLDYEQDLAILYTPFPILVKYYKEGQILKNNNLLVTPVRMDTLQHSNRYSQRSNQIYDRGEVKAVKMNSVFDNSYNTMYILRQLFIVLLILTTIIMFQKSQYLELLICFTFIIQYENQQIGKKVIFYYMVSILASFIVEFIWLYLCSSNWLNYNQQQFFEPKAIHDWQKIIVIFIWISQAIKICILTAFYYLNSYLMQHPSQPNQLNQGNNRNYQQDTENSQFPVITQNDIHSNNLTPNQKNYYNAKTDNTIQKTPTYQQQGQVLNFNNNDYEANQNQGQITTLNNQQNLGYTPTQQQQQQQYNNNYIQNFNEQGGQQQKLYSLYNN